MSFRGSNRAGSASTTSQTRPCAPSACVTTTTRSPRTRSSITSTAFCTRPAYRERFANDLAKELPRIPLAPDFHAFAKAGRELAELHLGYETCEEYSLEVAFAHSGDPRPSHFRIGDRAMRFADDEKTVLAVNEHVSLRGIPASVHTYQVNGRSPLEWFINRYRITQNKESGIVNDPNGWFDDPRELVAAIRRIVHVSVETARIVTGLPEPIAELRGSK